jgi:uncharacterized damage-inducible protein DinB
MIPELYSYLQMITDLRGQVRTLIAELSVEALNWHPIEAGDEHVTNSLAALAAHVAGAEHYWIGEVVGGRPATRDRNGEFATESATAADLVRQLDNVGVETKAVFLTLTAAQLSGERQARGRRVPVRWCILHVIDHTALHLGHMQLTYQLWKRGESGPSPRWYERLENRD